MTFNPYYKTSASNYEGAKYSTWIVHHSSDSLVRGNNNGSLSTGSSPNTKPVTESAKRTPTRSSNPIETLKDPFGDGISINGSDSRKIMLPTGKYWLDWRIGVKNGTNTYNHYFYFAMGIGGYVEGSINDERWICRGNTSYLEEQTSSYNTRNICGYYESTSSSCYIVCLANRVWSSWPPGGTPTLNSSGASSFGTSTDFPYGESRLLVMRLE